MAGKGSKIKSYGLKALKRPLLRPFSETMLRKNIMKTIQELLYFLPFLSRYPL